MDVGHGITWSAGGDYGLSSGKPRNRKEKTTSSTVVFAFRRRFDECGGYLRTRRFTLYVIWGNEDHVGLRSRAVRVRARLVRTARTISDALLRSLVAADESRKVGNNENRVYKWQRVKFCNKW